MTDLGAWPAWGWRFAWTIGTLIASWGIGYLVGVFVAARLPKWLPARQQALAASAVQALRRRLPWWSLLVGAWVAAGYWPLTPEGSLLVGRVVFVLATLSVTFAAASIAVRTVDLYGGARPGPTGEQPDTAHRVGIVSEVGGTMMAEVPGGVGEFEPFVRYHTFADSSVNFTVILRAREFVDQYLIKHEFIKRLHARFSQEGIVIPFPIRTIAQRDEPAGSLPTDVGA